MAQSNTSPGSYWGVNLSSLPQNTSNAGNTPAGNGFWAQLQNTISGALPGTPAGVPQNQPQVFQPNYSQGAAVSDAARQYQSGIAPDALSGWNYPNATPSPTVQSAAQTNAVAPVSNGFSPQGSTGMSSNAFSPIGIPGTPGYETGPVSITGNDAFLDATPAPQQGWLGSSWDAIGGMQGVAQGVNALSGIGQTVLGFQQLGLAEDQYNFTRNAWQSDYNMRLEDYNRRVDRQEAKDAAFAR